MAIALLDDADGICDEGYQAFQEFVTTTATPDICNDIFDMVDAADGRFYLPEDHGLTADEPETPAPTVDFVDANVAL